MRHFVENSILFFGVNSPLGIFIAMILLVKTLLIGLFVCFSIDASSQSLPDSSLHTQLAKAAQHYAPGDTTKAAVLNELAIAYLGSQPDSSLYFAKRAYHASGKFFSMGQLSALNSISRAYYASENYDLALMASQQTYSLSKKLNDKGRQCSSINTIGLIYLAQNNLPVALEKFKEAASLATALKDTARMAAIYLNIGICYNDLDQPVLALPALEKSLFYSEKMQKLNYMAVARNRLGEVFRALKNLPEAIRYQRAVILDTAYQDIGECSFAYSGLAKSYYEQGDYKQAIAHGKKGLVLALEATTRTWETIRSTEALSLSYAALTDYKHAYQYLQLNTGYNNKLIASLNAKEINGLHLKQQLSVNRELLRKEQLNKEKLQLNRLIMAIASGIAFLMVVIFYLLYRNYLQKKKLNGELQKRSDDIARQRDLIAVQNEKLSELNKTKDQLFSVIGHDLRNPFAAILQALQMIRNGDLSEAETRMLMDSFYNKVSVTSAMLDNLLLWANSQIRGVTVSLERINLPIVIDQQLGLMKLLAMEKNIVITHQMPVAPLAVLADEGHVRVILQNLVGNAIKFTPEGGRISVEYQIGIQTLQLYVRDNGVGMTAAKLQQLFTRSGQEISTYGTKNEKGIGIGLLLVKKYLAENNATLEVKSGEGKGTCFIVNFKRID